MSDQSIYVVSLDWYQIDKLKKLTPEAYADFRALGLVPDLPEKLEDMRQYHASGEFLANLEDVRRLLLMGLEPVLKRVKGVAYPTVADSLPPPSQAGTVVYNVSVPNVGLLDVKRVSWLEDACTEDLQKHLDDGWRILAVCPPNDSRRPTYIIGHTDPEMDRKRGGW